MRQVNSDAKQHWIMKSYLPYEVFKFLIGI